MKTLRFALLILMLGGCTDPIRQQFLSAHMCAYERWQGEAAAAIARARLQKTSPGVRDEAMQSDADACLGELRERIHEVLLPCEDEDVQSLLNCVGEPPTSIDPGFESHDVPGPWRDCPRKVERAVASRIWNCLPDKADFSFTDPDPIRRVSDDELRRYYPEEALREGLSATVRAWIVVDSHGDVVDPILLGDPGHGFAEAAHQVLSILKFRPALKDGHPVASRIPYTLHFKVQ